jgi:hypothetical protein
MKHLQKAQRYQLSGATVWHGEANGCRAQWVTPDWELILYARPVVEPLTVVIDDRLCCWQGVELVDAHGIRYARNGMYQPVPPPKGAESS